MISTWLYQYNTPIVGTRSQYNTYISSTNRSYVLQSFVLSIGLTGLTNYLVEKVPVSPLAKSIATAIFSTIQNNKALNTPTLYANETRWGMDGSPNTNYQVIQKWYSDSAHTKYVCTTIYYCSFV
ncbi:hypothetical protein ACJDU8_16970 [Clostridium sp. WILCCON 0269]|uniref:Uncharacterized protein n=1 Tax=Candidatus Clostridium eludens TaxID=3381663 RepID=A0ABW8SPG9_9CLOT